MKIRCGDEISYFFKFGQNYERDKKTIHKVFWTYILLKHIFYISLSPCNPPGIVAIFYVLFLECTGHLIEKISLAQSLIAAARHISEY